MNTIPPQSYREAYGSLHLNWSFSMLNSGNDASPMRTAIAAPAPVRSGLTAYDALEAIRDNPDFQIGNDPATSHGSC